jgi:hypothetical protein
LGVILGCTIDHVVSAFGLTIMGAEDERLT